MRKFLRFLLISFCALFFLVGFLRLGMIYYADRKTVEIVALNPVPVVIVPGAGLSADGTLPRRCATASVPRLSSTRLARYRRF
jgi:hypothetical protein